MADRDDISGANRGSRLAGHLRIEVRSAREPRRLMRFAATMLACFTAVLALGRPMTAASLTRIPLCGDPDMTVDIQSGKPAKNGGAAPACHALCATRCERRVRLAGVNRRARRLRAIRQQARLFPSEPQAFGTMFRVEARDNPRCPDAASTMGRFSTRAMSPDSPFPKNSARALPRSSCRGERYGLGPCGIRFVRAQSVDL